MPPKTKTTTPRVAVVAATALTSLFPLVLFAISTAETTFALTTTSSTSSSFSSSTTPIIVSSNSNRLVKSYSTTAATTTTSPSILSYQSSLLFPSINYRSSTTTRKSILAMSSSSSSSSSTAAVPSWSTLQSTSASTSVGSSLNNEQSLRATGRGSPFVQSKLRLFNSPPDSSKPPKLTLYRDHAGWCPYCQKTMLLIEEKQIPINIELVAMRSYGDKPQEFLNMVPSGLLPALIVEGQDGRKQVITESQVIMELLDQWHPTSEGYLQMLPNEEDGEGWSRYDALARLERELFSWWCTLLFRPEGPRLGGGGGGGLMGMLTGKNKGDEEEKSMSGSMKAFLDCLTQVDNALTSTPGPWFFSSQQYPHPTMIDFIFVSHVERMLASVAYWKGLNLRSKEEGMVAKYPGLNAWLDAFEKRECYLAFKSDYYTHVMDIPPQYGPGFDGGFEEKRREYSQMINGRDGKSWKLPLPHDDPLQPLYRGPPLPLCALQAAGITPDADGTYEQSDPEQMAKACRHYAGWKLSGNGDKVSRFAARGGPDGSKNPRKSFGAQLADPYANPDESVRPCVDAVLRIVCSALLEDGEGKDHTAALKEMEKDLESIVPSNQKGGVVGSLAYLRDRVGVPRDMPLAAARQFRAHLNWAIDVVSA